MRGGKAAVRLVPVEARGHTLLDLAGALPELSLAGIDWEEPTIPPAGSGEVRTATTVRRLEDQ